MTEQEEKLILENLEDFIFEDGTNILERLTTFELGELVNEVFNIKKEIDKEKGKSNVPTLDTPMKRKYEIINNKQYYRFSPYIGTVHLYNEKGEIMCGKNVHGVNYAQYKPFGTICSVCKDKINSLDSNS